MCSYSWNKDGTPLTTSKETMKVYADNGTLMIMSPGLADEGLYQCFASTTFGIAAGVSIQLQQACESFEPAVVLAFCASNTVRKITRALWFQTLH